MKLFMSGTADRPIGRSLQTAGAIVAVFLVALLVTGCPGGGGGFLGASITVIAPNGGEEYAQGSECTIQWEASRVDGNVTIRLLAGGTEQLVVAQVSAEDESYSWTVSTDAEPGSAYTIGIEAAGDPEVSDESDAEFTIGPPSPWTLVHGGIGDESANDLAILPDGDIILAGYASDTANGAQDVYLVRLNALGGIEWEARYNDTNSETTKALAVASASDGGIHRGWVHL